MRKEIMRHKEKGFTLLEIVLVMVISGILMASILGTVILFSQGLTNALSHINAMQDIRNIYTTLQADMADVPYGNINSVSPTFVSFRKSNNTTVIYKVSGNQLLRNDAPINRMALTAIFEYYDDQGAFANSVGNIARIALRIELTNPRSGKSYKLFETFALK